MGRAIEVASTHFSRHPNSPQTRRIMGNVATRWQVADINARDERFTWHAFGNGGGRVPSEYTYAAILGVPTEMADRAERASTTSRLSAAFRVGDTVLAAKVDWNGRGVLAHGDEVLRSVLLRDGGDLIATMGMFDFETRAFEPAARVVAIDTGSVLDLRSTHPTVPIV
jgi:aminoglycoside phosphotransferase (APT) family kinase protein